ncbi:MAG: hypothetical protein AMXMBFR36_30290 [Acidobacteriota bacterium]
MGIAGPRFVLALCLIAATSVRAQPGACAPELLATDRRGSPSSISRQGDVLYLGAGAAVVVVDTTDLAAPLERGRVDLDEMVLDVAHWQSTVVALGQHGLTFVDASDSEHPTVTGSFPFPAAWIVRSIAARESHAFVPEVNGLRIVSFVDPTAPAEVGFFPAVSTRDVAVSGQRAYLLSAGILRVVNVSNPASPYQVASLPVDIGNDDRLSIAGSGNRLAAWGRWSDGHFTGSAAELFSLADPALPVKRSSLVYDDYGFESLAFAFDRVYFGGIIYDVASLANPVEVGTLLPLFWPVDMAIAPDPDRLFVAAADGGLHVAEISSPGNPSIEASIYMPSDATDGYLAGTMAVLVREDALEVFDLSDPAHPARLSSLPAGAAQFEEVERVRDHAYVRSAHDLKIVDLSNPLEPVQTGSVGYSVWNAPAFAGGVVGFVDDCAAVVRLLDASQPGAPQFLSEIPLDENCYKTDFAMTAERLYVWDYDGFDGDSRLRTFDLSDPAQPLEIGAAAVDPWHWSRSAVRGRYLLLTDEDRFGVLDLAAPANPIPAANLSLPGGHWFLRKLTVYGGVALVAPHSYSTGSDDRLVVVDVSNPPASAVIAEIDPAGRGNAAFAGPGLIMVADGPAGYSIYSSCVPFADGFESGDASEWSLAGR